MKEIIFSFILYVLYDAFMRQREKDKYVTQTEFKAYKSDLIIQNQKAVTSPQILSVFDKVKTLEKVGSDSAFA